MKTYSIDGRRKIVSRSGSKSVGYATKEDGAKNRNNEGCKGREGGLGLRFLKSSVFSFELRTREEIGSRL